MAKVSLITLLTVTAFAVIILVSSFSTIQTGSFVSSRNALLSPSNLQLARIAATKPPDPPGCAVGLCSTGLVDYGIGPKGGRYNYSAQDVQGFIDFSTIKIIEGSPGFAYCLDPNAGLGDSQCFGVQLNWVMHNVRDGRNILSDYWAQDVAQIAYDKSCTTNTQYCVPGTFSVIFISNVWNFSANNNGMLSGFTGNLENRCSFSSGGLAYECINAIYYNITTPFSIWAGMTIGPSKSGTFGPCKAFTVQSCVGFFGEIIKNNLLRGPGYFDGLVFANNKHSSPKFFVSGKALIPTGAYYDAEWVLGGACCGASAALNISATMQEEYSLHGAPGTYVDVKHAWVFGGDTGESVLGVYMFADFGARSAATVSNNPPTDYSQNILW